MFFNIREEINVPEFNDEAERVMQRAKIIAAAFSHPVVHTIHLLASLTGSEAGAVSLILRDLRLTHQKIIKKVELLQIGLASRDAPEDLPWTASVEEIIKLAPEKAQELGHDYTGSEHLLLVLLDIDCTATRAIINWGISPRKVMFKVLSVLGINLF